MATNRVVEVCVKGQWFTVPSCQVGDRDIVVNGRRFRVARIHDELWLRSELGDPRVCLDALRSRSNGLRPDVFTFAQRLPATTPKYDYPFEWESIAAVRLPGYDEWWEGLPQESRKNTRRAAKRGVVVSVKPLDDELIRGIVALNNDSPMRQGSSFHHYGKSYEQVKRDQSTHLDRSEFICAHIGDELIGFLKIVYCDDLGTILLLITKPTHQDKRPANALIAKAVERCQEKGLSFIVYGQYRYGNQPRTSLMDFKDRNGFKEILVPRYYIPLTSKGRLGMMLRLHRDRVGMFPESVISVGRRIRTEWYKLKSQTSRCSSMVEQPKCNRQTERSNPPAGSIRPSKLFQ
jgi:hypothetical protein